MRQGANPVSTVIPHRDLMRTEIYNDFLRPSGHYYGINLFAFDGRDSIGDIRIWRRNGHADFDRDEVGLLSLIAPGFTQALKRIERRAQLKPRRRRDRKTVAARDRGRRLRGAGSFRQGDCATA